jgi:hypothetical protein
VRFSIANSQGVLSVLRDVLVQRTKLGELVALDQEPRQVGERATLETIVDDSVMATEVRVTACRPIVHNGAVVHELHLVPVEDSAAKAAIVSIENIDDLQI